MNKEFEGEIAALVKTKIKKNKSSSPVVFYGSSSFRLWETLPKDLPEINSLNIAFGGSTIQDCIDYYNQLLGQLTPKRVFFYAGDNDVNNHASAEEVLKRLQQLLSLIENSFGPIPFVFLSIKPSPERMPHLETIQSANKKIKEYLATKPYCDFIDVHSKMLINGIANPDLFSKDELHMNEEGYKIWTNTVKEYLKSNHI